MTAQNPGSDPYIAMRQEREAAAALEAARADAAFALVRQLANPGCEETSDTVICEDCAADFVYEARRILSDNWRPA